MNASCPAMARTVSRAWANTQARFAWRLPLLTPNAATGRPPALACHQVLQAIAVYVHEVQRMRLRQQLLEQVVLDELGVVLVAALLVPPNAEVVRGAAEDVGPAVAVHV